MVAWGTDLGSEATGRCSRHAVWLEVRGLSQKQKVGLGAFCQDPFPRASSAAAGSPQSELPGPRALRGWRRGPHGEQGPGKGLRAHALSGGRMGKEGGR